MAHYWLTTFGCQMNKHDSVCMQELLHAHGHVPAAEPEQADVVVLNTCSVREKAAQKLRSEVGRWCVLKRTHPALTIVVAGCVAEQEGRRLVHDFPLVDAVIGPDHVAELGDVLRQVELGAPPVVRTGFDVAAPRFVTAPTLGASRPSAYVTTMKGCDERCSFCVVPFTRGPERYRPSSDIIREIAGLVSAGVREVVLLGQTVNSYTDPLRALAPAPGHEPADAGESEFAALLRAVVTSVPGLARLRYEAPHPRHLSASLVRAHAELEPLARHVHLPVQSGSDAVLRRMVRRHTRADLLARVARLRAAVPELTISTDVIVGFPGESEEDFQQTLALLDEARFVGLFGFMYSPRPQTAALRLGDTVPQAVKEERLQRVFSWSEAALAHHLRSLVGATAEVLVEGPSKLRPELPSGRTARNEIVHLVESAELAPVGSLVAVELTEALGHSLLGRVVRARAG